MIQDSSSQMSRAVEILNHGGVLVYPTETVYGLGGDARNLDVIRRIYQLKQRSVSNPLSVLISNAEKLKIWVSNIPNHAKMLIDTFWPGPLTLIFHASGSMPELLTGPERKIAIRVSPDPICQKLCKKIDYPLITTSANPSGLPPARSAEQAMEYFGDRVDCVLDGGVRHSSLPSTVLDVTVYPPNLKRLGGITQDQIQQTIGEIVEH
jgi:L-threonylcarbamoyladenylate synthase